MIRSVDVAGVMYNVVEKPFIEITGDRNYQGLCSFTDTELNILESLSEERKKSVFVHELLHAIFYEAGYDEHDEDMINRVANVLCQVLKNNDFRFLK